MIIDTLTYTNNLEETIRIQFPEYWKKTRNIPKAQRDKIAIISQEEVNILHKKYKEEGDFKSRDRLIYSQLKLVYYYAIKYHFNNNGTTLAPEDLLGFANEILVNIIDIYDPYKGKTEEEIANGEFNKLPSFIQTWLRSHLHKKLKDYGLEIRLPHNQITNITLNKRYTKEFEIRYGRYPYDGESYEIVERNNKTKERIERKITFDYTNKLLYIELYKKNKWVFEKEIKILDNMSHAISGNQTINEDGDEILDTIQDDLEFDNSNKNIIYSTLKEVIEKLDERDKELIMLGFFHNEAKKDAPCLLTPNYKCQKESKTLAKTSLNVIDIYITVGIEKIHLKYNITSNYHVKESEDILQSHKKVDFITHAYKNKSTSFTMDNYKFKVDNASDIKITHKTCSGIKEIKDYTYNNGILDFNVNYYYGAIFTPMTFNNKKNILLLTLRKQLKHLKHQNY